MSESGPIIIIEDDKDDREILEEVIKNLNLPNKVISFEICADAYIHLKNATELPFIIICDVNLPRQSGLDFKKRIDEDEELRRKSIPFIFYSTAIDQYTVNAAYSNMMVQGYFQKPGSYEEIRSLLKLILDYWQQCRHPTLNKLPK